MENEIISFNLVKVEPSAVCHGCLSTGRILLPLQDNTETYVSLLSHKTVLDLKITNILLCWECSAYLRRIRRFKNRIQNAQWTLQQSQYLLDHTQSLSTLSTVKLNTEITVEHVELNTEEKTKLIDKNIDINEIICKVENVEVDIEYDVQYTDEEHDIKEEFNKQRKEKNNEYKESDECRESLAKNKNYSRKAKISSNPEVDLDNPEKHFSNISVTASEIDELIMAEDRGNSFKKRRYNCKVCKRGFKSSLHIKRHQTFQHPKKSGPFKCLECNAALPSLSELQAHWSEHNYVFQCNMCPRRFTERRVILRHIANHSNLLTCLNCGMEFNFSKDFSKHYKDLHKQLICDHCGLKFSNKNSILKHMRRHHLTHRCVECNKYYKTYKNLTSHYSFCHPSLVCDVVDASLSYCVECDKQFNSVNRYKRHLRSAAVHSRAPRPRNSVPCPGCGKVFTRKVYMKNHYKLVHGGKTKHYCGTCDKYFITAHAARKHQRFVHEKAALPKNKICDICGRGFSTNRILIHHRRTHTGERPHQCAHCAAAFAQLTALKTHERTQHKHAIN